MRTIDQCCLALGLSIFIAQGGAKRDSLCAAVKARASQGECGEVQSNSGPLGSALPGRHRDAMDRVRERARRLFGRNRGEYASLEQSMVSQENALFDDNDAFSGLEHQAPSDQHYAPPPVVPSFRESAPLRGQGAAPQSFAQQQAAVAAASPAPPPRAAPAPSPRPRAAVAANAAEQAEAARELVGLIAAVGAEGDSELLADIKQQARVVFNKLVEAAEESLEIGCEGAVFDALNAHDALEAALEGRPPPELWAPTSTAAASPAPAAAPSPARAPAASPTPAPAPAPAPVSASADPFTALEGLTVPAPSATIAVPRPTARSPLPPVQAPASAARSPTNPFLPAGAGVTPSPPPPQTAQAPSSGDLIQF